MLLIDPSLIRNRLTLEDKDEINDVLKSSIAGAIPSLESTLQTTFAKGSAEDRFSLGDPYSPIDGMFLLKLNNGFVRLDPALTVFSGDSYWNIDTPETQFRVMLERGVVKVPDYLRGKFIRVVYDYGFSTYKEVPAWLQEAALSVSLKVLSMNAVNDKKDELSKVFEYIDSHSATILNGHLRTGSFLIPPV